MTTGRIGRRLILPWLSLQAGGMVRFHCRMSVKTRRLVKTTLLGAATTALTVKAALTSPIGVVAEGPLDKLKHNVDQKKQQVLTQSRKALDQAAARLVASLVAATTTGAISSPATPKPSPDNQVRPSGAAASAVLPPGR